ncbi:MAG: helix-turn-helix domain-containing protein [Nocardioidaceae bacterium]
MTSPTDMIKDEMSRYVSIDDAAKATGVPRRTITRWARTGRCTSQLRGKRFLVDPAEVDQLEELRQHTHGYRLPHLGGSGGKAPGSGTVATLPDAQYRPGIDLPTGHVNGSGTRSAARLLDNGHGVAKDAIGLESCVSRFQVPQRSM